MYLRQAFPYLHAHQAEASPPCHTNKQALPSAQLHQTMTLPLRCMRAHGNSLHQPQVPLMGSTPTHTSAFMGSSPGAEVQAVGRPGKAVALILVQKVLHWQPLGLHGLVDLIALGLLHSAPAVYYSGLLADELLFACFTPHHSFRVQHGFMCTMNLGFSFCWPNILFLSSCFVIHHSLKI